MFPTNLGDRMNNPGSALLVSCLLLLAPVLRGCGTEGPAAVPAPPRSTERVVSCDDLQLRDPRTGSNFSCLGCRKEWGWRLGTPQDELFFLVELTCGGTTGAELKIRDPEGLTIWRTEVKSGDSKRICVSHEESSKGIYTLQLGSSLPLNLTSFSGSIWINLYDQHGTLISPGLSPFP
jgi:hypothetical protein